MDKKNLFGHTLAELETVVNRLGMPRFVAKQIADWLYKKKVDHIALMQNISQANRLLIENEFYIEKLKPVNMQESVDGTKKYLFSTQGNQFIEVAYIPDNERATICVSSQVGCKMGCLFCMTAKQGFNGQLTAGEIVNQVVSIPEFEKLTNIVYMGMGEPFDNIDNVLKSLEILTSSYALHFSHKRITVSTVGVIPGMKRFLDESQCHLAVSLHSPFDEERRHLMPVQQVYPVAEVVEEIKKFDLGKQRRVSFEYIMFKGLNDKPMHVNELARLLNGLQCRVNLIRFHEVPGVPLQTSDDKTIRQFQEGLNNKGIVTTIRASRGQDILAACGMLSTKQLLKNNSTTIDKGKARAEQ